MTEPNVASSDATNTTTLVHRTERRFIQSRMRYDSKVAYLVCWVSMPSDFAALLLTDMLAAFIAPHPVVSLELDLSPRRVDLFGENFDLAPRMSDLPNDTLLAA